MELRAKPNNCHDAEAQNTRVDQESYEAEGRDVHEGQESYEAGAQCVRAGQESGEVEAWTEGLMRSVAAAKWETVSCTRFAEEDLMHA